MLPEELVARAEDAEAPLEARVTSMKDHPALMAHPPLISSPLSPPHRLQSTKRRRLLRRILMAGLLFLLKVAATRELVLKWKHVRRRRTEISP